MNSNQSSIIGVLKLTLSLENNQHPCYLLTVNIIAVTTKHCYSKKLSVRKDEENVEDLMREINNCKY